MIFVDLDSTLNDLIETWVKNLNFVENKSYTLDDVDKWGTIFELYDNPKTILKQIYNSYVKPLPKAIEFVNKLQTYDKVIILTDTHLECMSLKEEWLNKYFPNIHYVFTDNDKEKYMKTNDIFIDDKFTAVYKAVKEKDVYGFLFRNNDKYKYNDYIWDYYKFKRVNNYEEILEEVDKIYKRA